MKLKLSSNMLPIQRIFPMGEQLILIEFAMEVNFISLQKLLKIKAILSSSYQEQKVEIIHTYTAISIRFLNHYNINLNDEIQFIKDVISSIDLSSFIFDKKLTIHRIPVCYEDEMATDLKQLSKDLKLTKQAIIDLHTQPTYTIYFHGFLPGFLYLGGLPKPLHYPRRKSPRLVIPKGSVGIGGSQTGVYPQESPGGWQLIGRSPISWFDVNIQPPSLFQPGEQLEFYAITKATFFEIQQQIEKGNYQHQIEIHD